MLKLIIVIIACLGFISGYTQDLAYVRKNVETLASPDFYGRGYVKKGDKKAAKFIESELSRIGISPFRLGYIQRFSFPMNTFPSTMSVILDKNELKAGCDYVVSPDCKTVKGTYDLVYLSAKVDTNDAYLDSILKLDFTGKFVVAPFDKRNIFGNNPFKASGVIIPKSSVSWWASTGHNVAEVPVLMVKDSFFAHKPAKIAIDVKNKFYKSYITQNVIGFIEGNVKPDSFIVFTAHYDHLGMMGKGNVFAGANDNASGTAMVMDLAKHYSQDKPKYSMVFIFFSGEEAGLLGSEYFVEHPAVDLTKAKMIINLDMVGTGSDGIGIVNGREHPEITDRMKIINSEYAYLSKLNIRKNACNSDHCPFAHKGLPAIFIYTQGKEHTAYHNLNDTPNILPFTKYNELFNLLVALTK